MQTYVISDQVVLRLAMDRGRQIGDNIAEPTITPINVLLGLRPRQIDMTRLRRERSTKSRVGGAAHREVDVTVCGIPHPFAVCHRDQKLVGSVVFDPVFDLATDPL